MSNCLFFIIVVAFVTRPTEQSFHDHFKEKLDRQVYNKADDWFISTLKSTVATVAAGTIKHFGPIKYEHFFVFSRVTLGNEQERYFGAFGHWWLLKN